MSIPGLATVVDIDESYDVESEPLKGSQIFYFLRKIRKYYEHKEKKSLVGKMRHWIRILPAQAET